MALEAVVFSQDPFLSSCFKDLYSLGGASNFDFGSEVFEGLEKPFCFATSDPFYTLPIQSVNDLEHSNSNSPEAATAHQFVLGEIRPLVEGGSPPIATGTATQAAGRRKRRRRSMKNKEEVENQRMTHIAVERNRRKQMNEYLAIIRSLMPPTYVQRGDQASIIGGAINYVKELEQLLQSLEAQKRIIGRPEHQHHKHNNVNAELSSVPFADFFTFPQYSTRSNQGNNSNNNSNSVSQIKDESAAGEIEVTMVESHACLKILTKKQPKQLSKLVAAFQSLRLSVLHLNVTAADHISVLYSFSLKVEEGSQLSSTDEIAAAANHILRKIEEEACLLK
ncbi:hypothetical protein Ancab_036469 [Ancistrocladus abbreviatus]